MQRVNPYIYTTLHMHGLGVNPREVRMQRVNPYIYTTLHTHLSVYTYRSLFTTVLARLRGAKGQETAGGARADSRGIGRNDET